MKILSGIKVIEFEGLGPGPFCGMHLADLGADVILIARKGGMDQGKNAVFNRGKRSIALDLKNEKARDLALSIAAQCDALIEGLRPGVMERLGLGPEAVRAHNKRLVYGRLTGWGQSGPLSHTAGHDLNYVSLSGAAWYSGAHGDAPVPPPTMVGDVGGGALYLTIGILAGILRARETGEGAVIDAAIVDGSAHMMNLLYSLRAAGGLPDERGASMLDGAQFYGVYECADGDNISIGPLEPKFYALMLDKLGLQDDPVFAVQFDQQQWAAGREKLAALLKSKPRDHWVGLLGGTDVCFAPVLNPSEAAEEPHMKARKVLRNVDGVMQAAAAPRFNGETPPDPQSPPSIGQHTEEILSGIGLGVSDIENLREEGVI